jgi:hypothetical protein
MLIHFVKLCLTNVKKFQDLKSFVVAQYSTHFEELQTILEVKKAVLDMGVSSKYFFC